MREQVITSPGTRRAVTSSKGFVQRPTRRESAARRTSGRNLFRTLLGYVPAIFKYVMAAAALIALVLGYRAAASASLFQVQSVDVSGASRVSTEEITTVTRRAVSHTGVWRADLAAISANLQRLPGVRRAIVTRVLPDGLRVRIIERVPVAVVRTSAGHFLWVDDEGMALGEMKATDHMPAFFIRGWNEEDGDEIRKENAERVQRYLELTRAWDLIGLSERVSEVSLIDIRDVRAQLAGDDSQIEVRLGAEDFGERLKAALGVLDAEKSSPRAALINYVDLTQGKRAVIGFSTGSKLSADRDPSEDIAKRMTAAANSSLAAQPATDGNSSGTAKPNRSVVQDRKSPPDKKQKVSERSQR